MRVLHITRDFPPQHRGGISTAVYGLARAQARAGLEVAVVSFDDWRPARPHAGGVTSPSGAVLPRDLSTPWRAALPCSHGAAEAAPSSLGSSSAAAAPSTDLAGIRVVRITAPAQQADASSFARAQRPALLHVHHGMLWPFAVALRDQLGVPAVKSVHVVQRRVNELRGSTERTRSLVGQEAALAGADRVVVPSRAAADALVASTPGLAARLRIVGHGIDDSDFARAAAAQHAGAPAHGLLLAAGRFADVKGTEELFEAVRAVLARVPDATAVVAGGVPGNRRAEARWWRRWQTGTPAALHARTRAAGWLEAHALAECYRDAAALIVPSRFETFGLVALEAMLHGLPVAATAAGALAELVVDGESGLLSAPGDAAALAEHAVALLTEPALAARLGRAGAQAVRAEHLWEHVLPRMLAVYAELA